MAGPRSTIGRASDSQVRGPGFDTQSGNILSFLLPLLSRRAVVSYWRKYVHEVLVNRLGGLSLPRKSVVRLTDRPDMTLDVYRGRKTTMQQQQIYFRSSFTAGLTERVLQSPNGEAEPRTHAIRRLSAL